MKIVGMSHKEITYERKKHLAKSPKKKTKRQTSRTSKALTATYAVQNWHPIKLNVSHSSTAKQWNQRVN